MAICYLEEELSRWNTYCRMCFLYIKLRKSLILSITHVNINYSKFNIQWKYAMSRRYLFSFCCLLYSQYTDVYLSCDGHSISSYNWINIVLNVMSQIICQMEIFILSLLLTFFENYYRPQVTRHPIWMAQ